MTLLRKRRLGLVLVAAAVAATGIGGLVAYRVHKINHAILVARDNGYGEYQRGDYPGTIRDLGIYLGKSPADPTALRAFAEARLKVEEPDGTHLITAINAFRRLLDLQIDKKPELEHRLADLYMQAGLNTECVAMADTLLAQDPADAPVLHDLAMAQYRLRKFNEAVATNQKYITLRPGELEARVLQLELQQHMSGPQADPVVEAAKVQASQPNDVRGKILLSIAYTMKRDQPNARKWAHAAAAGKAQDPLVAGYQIQQLWRTGEVQLGDAVLEDAIVTFKDPALQTMWARRLYQLGRYSELLKLTPVEPGNPNLRANVGGYQCLASLALKDVDKAKAARDALANDGQSAYAHDWAAMLDYSIAPDATTVSTRTRTIKEISGRHADNAYFQMMQASVTQAAGDYKATLHTWDEIALRETAWAAPLTRMAEVFVGMNQFPNALIAARGAVARAPDDRDALVVLAMATAGGAPDDAKTLATILDQIHQKFPEEQRTMALRASVKAKNDGHEAGVAAIQEVLALKTPPALPVFLQLASVSHGQKLGQEDACFAAAEKAYGVGPDLALAKAALLSEQGQAAQGAAMLKDLRSKATTETQGWDLAYARYLEATHDAAAHDLWVAISAKYDKDQRVQWMALNAPSIQADHMAAGQVIERLQPLMGETDYSFKLARARWLLEGTPGNNAVTQATDLLADMTKSQPDVLAPHLLLAECMERSRNFSGAIDHLETAAHLSPDAAPITIELAQLLQNQGEMDRAGAYITTLAARTDLDALQQRQVAGLLARQGDPQRAAALLDAGIKKGVSEEANRLILAALAAQLGKTDQAAAIFDDLMKTPSLPVIRAAAPFYATHGRMPDAEKAITALRALPLDPGVVATEEGDFAARFGKPEEVVAAYSAGLKAAPGNVQIWYRLIAFHLQNGAVKEAQAALDQALAAVPADKTLAALAANRRYIDTLSVDPRCRPILISLISAPQSADAAAAVLARLDKSGGTTVPDPQLAIDVTRLADRYPQYAALQTLAVEVDVLAKRFDDAVNIATRAMQTFPASPEPARLASAAYAASNRWSETLGASNQWRNRVPDQTLAPDVMIGLSYLGLNRPDDTLRQIQPYMDEAASDPDNYGSVIVLYGRSELAKNRVDNAEAKLWPFAKSSRRGMVAFLQIAGHDALPETGKRWLSMARPEMHNDMELEFVFATAATELAARAKDPAIASMALDEITHAVAAGNSDPVQLSMGYLALGMLQEQQSKSQEAAEAAYRKAMELNPKSDTAANNLAMVLARKGALPEALTYASQAVALAPKVAAYQDTLAFVQSKAGDHQNAIEHLRIALQLQPTNFEWRVNLAQAYLDAGQTDKAKSMFANSDGTPIPVGTLAPDVQDHYTTLKSRLGIKL